MQEDNQPHNLVFARGHVYVFPKPLVRPQRSFELYPETVGGPELAGSFTVYREDDYEALSASPAPTRGTGSTPRRGRRTARSPRRCCTTSPGRCKARARKRDERTPTRPTPNGPTTPRGLELQHL